jgi:hypothetical protein
MTYANNRPVRRSDAPTTLMIEPGWPVSNVKTLEDTDAARDSLVPALVKISAAIEANEASNAIDHEWLHRAKTAKRLKEAALARVNEIRARLLNDTPEKHLLGVLRDMDQGLFAAALNRTRQRFPEFTV